MTNIEHFTGRLGSQMFYWAFIRSWCEENGWNYEYLPNIMVGTFTKHEKLIRGMFTPGIPPTIDRVSIHVRRTDYVGNPVLYLLPLEYYRQAMAMFPGERFLVFSDDLAWCKQQDLFRGCEFYDAIGTPFQHLNRMASCKHNIVANSCFSWWAAWLNPNPNKRVVSPKVWDRIGNSPAWPGWIVIDHLNLGSQPAEDATSAVASPAPPSSPSDSTPHPVAAEKPDPAPAPPAPAELKPDWKPTQEAVQASWQKLASETFSQTRVGRPSVITVCLPGCGFEPGYPFMGWNELYAYLLQNFHVIVSADTGSNIYNLRTKLLKAITGTETEYVLWIDHDQEPTIKAFQLLYESLVQHPEIDIAAGWTYMQQRGGPILCSVGTDLDSWVSPESMANAADGIFPIIKTGMPFVLMRTSLLVKMAPNPFRVRTVEDEDGQMRPLGEDTGFCMTAQEYGAKMVCHTRAYVRHYKPQALEPPTILRSRMVTEEISGQEQSPPKSVSPLSSNLTEGSGMKHGSATRPLISLIHPTARLNPEAVNYWGRAALAWFESCDHPENVQYVVTVHSCRWQELVLTDAPLVVDGRSFANWAEVAFIRNTGLDTNVSQVNRGHRAATGKVLVGMMDDLSPPRHWDTLLLGAIPDVDAPFVVHASSSSPRDAEPLINAGCMTRAWYEEQGGYALHPDYEE